MKLEFDAEAVRQFCQERGIARLELFGSALRDDFDLDSDVDLLASIRPGVKCGLFEWVDWQAFWNSTTKSIDTRSCAVPIKRICGFWRGNLK
jgi:predicted nucleotidyltransferase